MGALLFVQAAHHFVHHLARHVRRQFGQFVRVQLFGGVDELAVLHHFDQRFPDRVGHFQQDGAVARAVHLVPDQQAVFQRQGFQDMGDVGRVQLFQLQAQRFQIVMRGQRVRRRLGGLRTGYKIFQLPLALEQALHQGQAFLQTIGGLLLEGNRHARLLPPRWRTRRGRSEAGLFSNGKSGLDYGVTG